MTKKKQRKDAQETRQRLLAAAAEVFAEKGYWESTHAEICRKAQANTAAVNYHFGSKENLYVEAWKYAFEKSVEAHPPEGGITPEAPVQERLHGRILALMQRIADPNNCEMEILHKEMANPTGLLTQTMQERVERMRQGMQLVVRELLGDRASERQVSLCVMSLVGQCFGPMLHLRHARRTPDAPRPVGPPVQFGVEELADHVTQFSLAGMQGMREGGGPIRKSGRKHGRSAAASGRGDACVARTSQEEPIRHGQETGIPDAQPGRPEAQRPFGSGALRAGGGVVRYERGKNGIVRHG
jgi:AcrR family transcriptional regulator